MNVYRSTDDIEKGKSFIATIGTFDGVHLGHKIVLKKLTEIASSNHVESLVITFHPHPRLVLSQDNSLLSLITSLDEKLNLLEQNGIQNVLLQSFTYKFSQMTGEDFIQNFLINKLNVKHLVIGYDHHFGNRKNNINENIQILLTEAKLDFTLIHKQEIDQISVSSTKIRNALTEGNIEIANSYLGYRFSIKGVVIHGKKLGRTLGFPTANIMLNDGLKIIPKDGVYAVTLLRNNKTFFGMLNIGRKPTVDGTSRSIEVHIFDLYEEIYGEDLRIEFVKKIRDEVKFDSLDALRNQLVKDESIVKQIFEHNV